MTVNRRQFSRIHFEAEAYLSLSGHQIAVELLDLSLKGALIRPINEGFIQSGSEGRLEIRLDDGETVIGMDTTVVHHHAPFYGLACRGIDLDSVTHLRRLVALNLGDEALLEREIGLLSSI